MDAVLDRRFQFAVEYVQNLPRSGPLEQSNEEKLKFYSLFKQVWRGSSRLSSLFCFFPHVFNRQLMARVINQNLQCGTLLRSINGRLGCL